MTHLLNFIHFYSQIFLGGAFLLSLACYFQTDWTKPIRSFARHLRKLIWPWALGIIILALTHPEMNLTPNKKIYLNSFFMVGRNIIYLALSWFCLKSLPRLSPLGLISFLFIGNFFAFDWGLSLEPNWSSNMYGLLYLGNGIQGALASMIFLTFRDLKSDEAKIDLVHLLLVISIVSFYFHFSQFVIVWMGNIPKEASFYLERFNLVPLLVVKLLPIAVIAFFKKLKIKPSLIKPICLLIIFSCLVEVFWLVRYP